MSDADELLPAWRMEFFAPVASFRDPLFPGLCRGLPVPPPSTVRGLLSAATGRDGEPGPFGMAAWSEGGGVDAETYHPIAANGTNPAVAGRVRAVKGGTTVRDRAFLTGVHLTVWLPDADGERIQRSLCRPVYPLRLGRSQDIVHPISRRLTTLRTCRAARVGHALAPPHGHDAPMASAFRLAASVSSDRLHTVWRDYLWCDVFAGEYPVRDAYRDDEGQAVWLLTG
ncbi:CRISPR-associated protein Cas5 [Wenjunlia vitaminophila]|uniref:CRISPR-associated protein Cas5 n=1 Tax=Wenjunlia vitaminophila TaxID=76728 RepID=A0A0T6LUF3_WENVI|nr:CRISPR-associated protein Cas5 [Wenjunlia vitaminophila]KRV49674.1 CRISPR-associated protein Cas5 [Wenjunlia vitaminophila]